MTEYQTNLLRKNGYERRESEFVEFTKTIELGDLTILHEIEVYDSENPDVLAYRGLVTLLQEGATRRVGEWDSERRYKLADVIIGCDRVSSLLQAVIKKVLDKNKGDI